LLRILSSSRESGFGSRKNNVTKKRKQRTQYSLSVFLLSGNTRFFGVVTGGWDCARTSRVALGHTQDVSVDHIG
ncbi:MAG: hypothetical protein KDD83_26310, partial [Caldilineaceae bacterium]|nr:hypothetical protein [Caldilineaceae bacterium]